MYYPFGGRKCNCITCICISGTNHRGWLLRKVCKCDGAVGVVFVLSCELSYAFGFVEDFYCIHSFVRQKRFFPRKILQIKCGIRKLVYRLCL